MRWAHGRARRQVSRQAKLLRLKKPVVVIQSGDRAELSSTDHGSGIDAARRNHLRPLHSQRRCDSTHYGGLGLGLYISRQIVELHGGSIRVRSQLGEGATFTVELPTGNQV